MFRLGELRCLSCGHDPDSVNTVCPCAGCHNVWPGSSSVVPAYPFTSGSGRDRYPQSSWGWWLAATVALMVVGFGALHGWHRTPVDTVASIVVPVSLLLGGVFWPEREGK